MQCSESLDGWWHAFFDEQLDAYPLASITEPTGGWEAIEEFKESVPVPGAWRDCRPGYRGIVWYERPFVLPDRWDGQRIYLHCGGIRSQSRLFLDCEPVGQVIADEGPFTINIGRLSVARIYRICICVSHWDDTGGIIGSVALSTYPGG
jgi:beta-galactosidase/beta-glucuronidase